MEANDIMRSLEQCKEQLISKKLGGRIGGTYDSGAHAWTSQRPPATRASMSAARPADRIPPAQVNSTTGLDGAPSVGGASGASASPDAAAVPTSSAGGGRRAASTDSRLETSADGRGLRLGAPSPEFASIGFGRRRGWLSPCRGWLGGGGEGRARGWEREGEVYGRRMAGGGGGGDGEGLEEVGMD